MSGFTSAVAVQIITAQAKHIFGLDVVRHNGYFKTIKVSPAKKTFTCDSLNTISRKEPYNNHVVIFLL